MERIVEHRNLFIIRLENSFYDIAKTLIICSDFFKVWNNTKAKRDHKRLLCSL